MRRLLGLVLLAILAVAISGCSTAEVSEKEASDWGKTEGDSGKDANAER